MKDKKAFYIYILLTLVMWQFCISLNKIITGGKLLKDENLMFFTVELTANNGAAFGILKDNSLLLGVLGIFVIIAAVFYVFKYVEFKDKEKILTLSMFTSGILGNTVQRLIDGYVTDFIKLTFINFPVFNLFDVLITGSIVVYILFFIREEILKGLKNRK